jgi:adenylosuccinate lyase
MLREEAYRLVQRNAMEAFQDKIQFDVKVKADTDIVALLSSEEISDIFHFDKYTKHIDTIYAKVYGN